MIEAYDRICRRRGVLDFDGLLESATQLLEHDDDVRDAFRWRTRHLFVDELQDMNPAQFDLLAAMAGDDPDLFCVGDPNQSIYGWNGADPHLARRPRRTVAADAGAHLCRATTDRPRRSSRGRPAALDRGPLDLIPASEGGSVPRIVAFADDEAEAAGVAAWCRSVHGRRAVLAPDGRACPDERRARPHRRGVRARRRAGLRLGAEHSPASDLEADGPRRAEPPEGEDAVVLSTIHRAKGLEWDHVAVTGLEEGHLPMSSATTAEQLAEERRLLYVAMTRPEQELLLTWSARGGSATRVEVPHARRDGARRDERRAQAARG